MPGPLLHRVVPFHGDELIAVQHQPDGMIYVHFGRICDNLGLARSSQTRKVSAHSVLQKGLVSLPIETEGGLQTVQCLRVDLLPLWMAGLHASRAKEHLRSKIERYQAEAAQVLWQAFKDQIIVGDEVRRPHGDDSALQQLEQIAELGRAITRMAEQQMELQRRQAALAGRMDAAARVIRGVQGTLDGVVGQLAAVDVRVGLLEERLWPGALIDDTQATEISNRVKALAELLTGREGGKNQYQAIFAELYRRFGVSSYKLIPQLKYEAVLAFLDDWRASAVTPQPFGNSVI
jgi:hypothetical protein